MIDIKKSIATGWGKGQLYPILKELQQFSMGMAGIQGEVFFVDAQKGYDGNDGKSWDKAFKTIAKAATVSNIIIAQSGKGEWRNTIFCRGNFTETITNFGEKVDLIGVGSCNAMSKARLTGTQAIAAGIGNGTRFINWEFYPDSTSPIFTFTDCYGIQFNNCIFTNLEAYNTTYAIVFAGTSNNETIIENCVFRTDTDDDPFETAAIHMNPTYAFGFIVRNNFIEGDIGILISCNTIYQGFIDNNIIKSVGLTISDASNDVIITRNMLITDANSTTLTDCVTGDVKLAAQNMVTGVTGGTKNYPPEAA